MNLCDYDSIKSLLGRHGFHFSKSMGQNFLIDQNILDKIVAGSGIDKTWGVLEIGPGAGTLTRELAHAAKNVVAVEIAKSLIPLLEDTLSDLDNVKVISDDV
jgi:16S rRNA (adenine1518-N6/adenine1519-N6)-dimethyltransferase